VQFDACFLRGFGRGFACVALIDEGDLHRFAGDMLDFLRCRACGSISVK
jgi:hypothetical protein